jgi:hypothetical protein
MRPRFQRGTRKRAILLQSTTRLDMYKQIVLATAIALVGSHSASGQDTSFAAMQKRGQQAMDVDQYTSIHRFDALPDGGRIELQRDSDDSVGIATIRAHIRGIAAAFKSGDFSTPEFVHIRAVPGSKVMAAKRSVITYDARDLPRGAELRIRTTDREALAAIREFMAFQRSEHHAGGVHPTAIGPSARYPSATARPRLQAAKDSPTD